MNACIASDEPTSYNPPQAPGSSSSDLTDPPKCALHNQRQTIRDETPFYDEINAAYRKADLQDSSVLDSKTTYSPFESPTVGHYTSLVSKNSNSSLNVSFREYSKFLQKEQDQEDDINILSSNPEDNFGDKFRRTVLRIVEKRKSRIKEEIDQKNREEKKRVGSPTDQACQKPQDDDSQNSQTLIIAKPKKENKKKIEKVVQEIVKDFSSDGDQKILRSIGRTATVNAAILATTLTGGAAGAGVAGLLTGGAMTAKRLGDGVEQEDETEVAKSIAVYGSATTASVVGQAVTGALLVGLAGVTLPVAGAVAFGVGCASGITAGALSEWGVDHALK